MHTRIVKGNVTVPDGKSVNDLVQVVVNYFDSVIDADKYVICEEVKKKSGRLHIEFMLWFQSLLSYRTSSSKFKEYLINNEITITGKSNMYCFAEAKNENNALSYCLKDGVFKAYKGFTKKELEDKSKLWVKKEKASEQMCDKIIDGFRQEMLCQPTLQPKDLWEYILSRYRARGRPFQSCQICSVFNLCCGALFPIYMQQVTDKWWEKNYAYL